MVYPKHFDASRAVAPARYRRPLAMLRSVATLRSANSQLALWREFGPGDALGIPKPPSRLDHISYLFDFMVGAAGLEPATR